MTVIPNRLTVSFSGTCDSISDLIETISYPMSMSTDDLHLQDTFGSRLIDVDEREDDCVMIGLQIVCTRSSPNRAPAAAAAADTCMLLPVWMM